MSYLYLATIESEEEREVISEFYIKMNGLCLNLATRITRDKSLAEVAVQESFVNLIKIKKYFFALDCNKRSALIVTIVRRKAIDIIRKQNRIYAELTIHQNEGDKFADDFDIGLDMESKENVRRIKILIGKLSDDYKKVLILRFFHDFSYNEIAKILDISVDLVGVRLKRARQKLLKMFKETDLYNGERE